MTTTGHHLNTWNTIFHPEWEPGGLAAVNLNVSTRIFEDFESYANDAAVRAVWTEGGGAANPSLTSVANALRGDQSIESAVSGSVGTLSRSIDNAQFGFPLPGRIRYITFRGTVDSGTDAITLRLGDASDANLYREWEFTLGTDAKRIHVVDLDPDNTEGYPAPTEGATAWNQELVDTLSFRDLAIGSTFRFDDIRFYYEYSLLDALGFGSDAPTDDGADGSVHSKLRGIQNFIQQVVGTTEQYSKSGPGFVYLNNSYTWGIELKGAAEQGIPSTDEIVPGNYIISRVRDGSTVEIVGSTGATESAGFISAAYTPLEDNWLPGDQIIVTFSGGSAYNDTDVAETTNNVASGQAAVTFPTVGQAYQFQAGQRVRLYDDDATEWNTVSSVDSPIQLTLGSNAGALYDSNPKIILSERTILQTARLISNVTQEDEINRELERWTLADYDDFDFADGDGNNERWDIGYIADSDGGAAGTEGGSADINTTTSGQARVRVDPDATPTRAAYALTKATPTRSKYYAVVVDADVSLNTDQATPTYAGLRATAGDGDDASNYVLVAREASSGTNRITAHAEFGGSVKSAVTFSTSDNAVAFKIERYENVWNVFYSLTQYPNWEWVKLTQYEDANGDMTSITTVNLYTESRGTVDAQVATADFDNFKYYIGSGALDQILETTVLGSGTFTNSSATVPADTGRAEANDFWNAVLLMPITGSLAYQPRVIVNFANAGGVFTLDPEAPFTSAPSAGDEYVLLAFAYPLGPAPDSANNLTSAHVIGNKSDAIPAMNLAPSSSSVISHLKAILERVGAAPADPDDSLLTSVGQRDSAATGDSLSDIATTDAQAKLRRILLRFSADAFSATVQGSGRTDIESMVAALATYLSSGGAAWAVTANPGGSSRDNLEQTLEDFSDMLAGANGIVTFPAPAIAGNGVSIAEVLRHAAEAIGEDTNNNVFASTNVAANAEGSVLERLEFIQGQINEEPQVHDVVIYPVAEDLGVTELNDDGGSPVFMPTSAATTSAANEGSAAVAWSEDVDFEQEGTITVVSIYAEFHWHTQYTDGGGSDNSYSKIQITGDGGSTWVDLTDTFANPTTGATTIRERNGVGRWISAITSGANQLQFRLVHWVSNGSDTSAARIRSNSYVRITYRKAP